MSHILEDAKQISFGDLIEGQKFATTANGTIVVWTKIYNGPPVFKAGDVDDDYTCPMSNAISDCGFPAVFRSDNVVCVVDTRRWNADYKPQ